MPSIDDFFPEKWLKAAHLITKDGRRPVFAVEIAGAGIEQCYDKETRQKEPRLVVEFTGRDKRLILNKTQATRIAELTGSKDYTTWRSKRIAVQAGTAHNGKDTVMILPAPAQPAARQNGGTNTNTQDQDQNRDPDPNQEQERSQEQDQ